MFILLAYFADSSNSGSDAVFLLILLAFGAMVCILGFNNYRRYRLMKETPIKPIRSAANGLIHVLGKTTGAKVLTSPVTKTPCFYYLVGLQELAPGTHGNMWVTTHSDHAEEPFYLEDASGRILVQPKGATCDMPDFSADILPGSWAGDKLLKPGHIDTKIAPSLGVPAPSDAEVMACLNSMLQEVPARFQEQHQIAPKEHPVMTEMTGFGPGGRPTITLENLRTHYKIFEQCVVAGRTYIILGTCAENPNPADEHDRKVIVNGVTTFLITSKTEKQAEKANLLRAVALILVGGAIITLAVAWALHALGAF